VATLPLSCFGPGCRVAAWRAPLPVRSLLIARAGAPLSAPGCRVAARTAGEPSCAGGRAPPRSRPTCAPPRGRARRGSPRTPRGTPGWRRPAPASRAPRPKPPAESRWRCGHGARRRERAQVAVSAVRAPDGPLGDSAGTPPDTRPRRFPFPKWEVGRVPFRDRTPRRPVSEAEGGDLPVPKWNAGAVPVRKRKAAPSRTGTPVSGSGCGAWPARHPPPTSGAAARAP
jgi:hypothetical protein